MTTSAAPLGSRLLTWPWVRWVLALDASPRRWALQLAVVALVSSFIMATPRYHLLDTSEMGAIVVKARDPLRSLEAPPTRHIAKREFRLVVPVVGHFFGFDRAQYLVLQALLGMASFAIMATVLLRWVRRRAAATALTLALALTYVGSAYLIDVYGWFDGVALFFLVSAIAVRHPVAVGVLVLLAGFTDERALIAAVGVALAHLAAGDGRRRWATVAAVPAALLTYTAVRLFLAQRYGLKTATAGIGLDSFARHRPILLGYGLFSALEGMWIVAAAAPVWAWRDGRRRVLALAIGGAAAASAVVGTVVLDVQRSAVYALPAVLAAVALCPAAARRFAPYALVLSLLVPLATMTGTRPRPIPPLPITAYQWATGVGIERSKREAVYPVIRISVPAMQLSR